MGALTRPGQEQDELSDSDSERLTVQKSFRSRDWCKKGPKLRKKVVNWPHFGGPNAARIPHFWNDFGGLILHEDDAFSFDQEVENPFHIRVMHPDAAHALLLADARFIDRSV